jgi:hypothetical protein
MALMYRAMSVQCPTTLTGTTSLPKVIAILSLAQLAIEPETTRKVHTIMERDTSFIQVHAEDSITTTVEVIRPTFQREAYGKIRLGKRRASEMMPLILFYTVQ